MASILRFGRSVISTAARTRVLVLHTTGRRSGRPRATPLAVHEDALGNLYVVGGAGGQARTPDWVANLRSDPLASVTLERCRFAVGAVELHENERAEAWAVLARVWPRIDAYQERAARTVPVFRLERR